MSALLRTWSVCGVAAAALTGSVCAPTSLASAEPCPDVDVVFARGTGEPPGVGGIGQAFVDALRAKTGAKSVAVYPVNYEASGDFADGMQFALTVIEGIRDTIDHVKATAANCPATRIVLGGFSQGAAVAAFSTADRIPDGVPAALVPAPMAPEIAKHVAAVALFGRPSNTFLGESGAPLITIGPLYVPKTIDQCVSGDSVCDGAPPGPPSPQHNAYVDDGLVEQAATFVAGRL